MREISLLSALERQRIGGTERERKQRDTVLLSPLSEVKELLLNFCRQLVQTLRSTQKEEKDDRCWEPLYLLLISPLSLYFSPPLLSLCLSLVRKPQPSLCSVEQTEYIRIQLKLVKRTALAQSVQPCASVHVCLSYMTAYASAKVSLCKCVFYVSMSLS